MARFLGISLRFSLCLIVAYGVRWLTDDTAFSVLFFTIFGLIFLDEMISTTLLGEGGVEVNPVVRFFVKRLGFANGLALSHYLGALLLYAATIVRLNLAILVVVVFVLAIATVFNSRMIIRRFFLRTFSTQRLVRDGGKGRL